MLRHMLQAYRNSRAYSSGSRPNRSICRGKSARKASGVDSTQAAITVSTPTRFFPSSSAFASEAERNCTSVLSRTGRGVCAKTWFKKSSAASFQFTVLF